MLSGGRGKHPGSCPQIPSYVPAHASGLGPSCISEPLLRDEELLLRSCSSNKLDLVALANKMSDMAKRGCTLG
jgi:hypothetical protein